LICIPNINWLKSSCSYLLHDKLVEKEHRLQRKTSAKPLRTIILRKILLTAYTIEIITNLKNQIIFGHLATA